MTLQLAEAEGDRKRAEARAEVLETNVEDLRLQVAEAELAHERRKAERELGEAELEAVKLEKRHLGAQLEEVRALEKERAEGERRGMAFLAKKCCSGRSPADLVREMVALRAEDVVL